MNFISICSGIEAASVAFGPLDWKAVAFSEIEPFPCTVLKHHYPDVPNFGDMTKFAEWPEEVFVKADAIVGGPPCQAFSVAGLRKGLTDARGNLTLIYVELIDHADLIRKKYGKPPVIALYENVPGIFSDRTNAYGCLLGALAGEDGEVVAPRGKWTDAGCVFGPQRTIAWRLFDAQYHGVAQRRRRVFVVASAREGFDPCAVLFESDGVRRDSAPSREAREEVTGTIGARASSGGGFSTDFECAGGLQPVITMAHGQGGAEIGFDRGPTPTCNHEAPIAAYAIQAGALRTNPNSGPDGVGVQADQAYTLEARSEVQAVAAYGIRTANTSSNGWDIQEEATHTLDQAMGIAVAHQVCITGDITHTLKAEGFDASEDGTGRGTPLVPVCHVETMPTLRAGASNGGAGHGARSGDSKDEYIVPVAFHPTQDPISSTDGTTHSMGCGSSQGQASIAVAVALRGREGGATAELGDEVQNCLRASGGGGDKAHVLAPVAFPIDTQNCSPGHNSGGKGYGEATDPSFTLTKGHSHGVATAMQVRRLTPRECERLQYFQFRVTPDYPGAWEDAPGEWWSPDYTLIPGKMRQINPAKLDRDYVKYLARGGRMTFEECCTAAADGPRYKALGNSWAVINVRWIGLRIKAELEKTDAKAVS